MRLVVLGSAAGGGFPQWNCACDNCQRVRGGDVATVARTQSSVAVCVDGEAWFLLNCSPDVRRQIAMTPALQPRQRGGRDSPIAGVILTNGDIDHLGGLLSLREGHVFTLHATPRIHSHLAANPVFDCLDPRLVRRQPEALDLPFPLTTSPGATGITATLFPVPGKLPLYLEAAGMATETEDNSGLELRWADRCLVYIPGCARITPAVRDRLAGATAVFFDGTFWQDDEMIRQGLGKKTGQRMGHISIAGAAGSLAQLASLTLSRRIYIHINNTNPLLYARSPERRQVEQAGWEVAYDGMEFYL